MAGFPVLLRHFSVAAGLWLASGIIYFRLHPLRQIKLIQDGNVAVAIAASAVCISLGLPLGFCLAGSINVWDIIIWSPPILLVQIAIVYLANLLIPNLSSQIQHGNVAAALFVASIGLTSAILLSASIMD